MKSNKILIDAQEIIKKYRLYKAKYNNCDFKDEEKWDLKVIDFRLKGRKLFEDINFGGCKFCSSISILCDYCVEAKKILHFEFFDQEDSHKPSSTDKSRETKQ